MNTENLTSERINTAINEINKRFKELTHYNSHTNLYVVQHTSKKNINNEIIENFYIYKDGVKTPLDSIASYSTIKEGLVKNINISLTEFLWNKCLALLL